MLWRHRLFLICAHVALPCGLTISGVLPPVVGTSSAFAVNPPNVVVFFTDDVGWTDWQRDAVLNPTGSVVYETPNLLSLAQAGVTFTSAYAAAPVCSPTRAAILTGKSPARTRVTDYVPGSGNSSPTLSQPSWSLSVAASEVTIAESFKAAGYATGHFGKWHLGTSGAAANPLQHGFDVNIGGGAFPHPGAVGGYFAGADGNWAPMPGLSTPGQFPADKYITDAITDHAVDFITQNQAGPFFMQYADYLSHVPIQAPVNLIAKYQTKINTLQGQGVDLKNHTNPTYAAMMEKMDESVGRLLDRLDDPNDDGSTSDSIRDNTIIVFTSDNGGLWASEGSPTRNLPLREGKGSLYEGGIREPMIVSWTGNANIAQASTTAALTSSYDILPTVLDLTGLDDDVSVPKNPNMDGVSIRGALEGEAFDRGSLYWHYPHLSPQDANTPLISGGNFVSVIRNGDWKMLFFYNDRHYELYNVSTDIGETTNLLSSNPNIAAELSLDLNNFLASVSAQMPISKANGQPVALPDVLSTPMPGDYNGDQLVDLADYAAWRAMFGSVTQLAADGNGNRVVDAADFVVWRNIFFAGGTGAGATLPGMPVPEPNALGLIGLAVIGIMVVAASRPRDRFARAAGSRQI